MNDDELDEVVERLKRVDKIIAELDPAIRAAAFAVLQAWVVSGSSSAARPSNTAATKKSPSRGSKAPMRPDSPDGEAVGDNSELDRDEFFLKFNHSKPSDNALLVVAWHYKQFGLAPFSGDDIRQIADEVGITVPARVDMTIANAQYAGKACFNKAGKGRYRPTVHGEARLKRSYGVKKGASKKQPGTEGDQ
jgi:hypothetical protein